MRRKQYSCRLPFGDECHVPEAVRAWEPAAGRAGAAWAALRRAGRGPAGLARLYAARRRWAARRLARARQAKVLAGYEYDSASYARKFDDGVSRVEGRGERVLERRDVVVCCVQARPCRVHSTV